MPRQMGPGYYRVRDSPTPLGGSPRHPNRADTHRGHVFIKGGVRLCSNLAHKAVFHRVDVSVTLQIIRVMQGALPESPLPDAPFAFAGTAVG